jgi:uncharacterized protein YjbJ (UPF0337 family)
MDRDRTEGKLKDIKGRVKRQAGEWSGNKDLQAQGAKEQVKGKAQNTLGKAKDFGRDVKRDAERDLRNRKRRDKAA